jgi:UDP-glucose 4-epimerase
LRITLIGGNGFIGSHIVDKLVLARKYKLAVFGRSPNKFSTEHTEVEYIYGDFGDINLLRKAIFGADIVLHLLSTTVPVTAEMDPAYDVRSNVIGTINLLEEVVKQKIKRFIYISSGGTVYGNPQYTPMDEKHPLNPISSYGIGKVTIENYVKLYADKHSFSSMIIRPSNPYGPRQNFNGIQGVISTFMYKMLRNEPITIWGDGFTIRDYIYIDDVSNFFIKAIESKEEGVFNLGEGIGISVNDIVNHLEKVTGIKANINYQKITGSGVKEVILDISKSTEFLNWLPNTELHSGIVKHYEWMKKEIEYQK